MLAVAGTPISYKPALQHNRVLCVIMRRKAPTHEHESLHCELVHHVRIRAAIDDFKIIFFLI